MILLFTHGLRMTRFGSLLIVLSISASAGLAAPVSATKNASGTVGVFRPLTLLKTADMDFASLAVTTGGIATIDPLTGQMSLSGGLLRAGGVPSPAQFTGAGSWLSLVVIRVPTQPVVLRRAGGSETLSVSNFTLDGSPFKLLLNYATFKFAVGAQLSVPAGAPEGTYTGTFNVIVDYY